MAVVNVYVKSDVAPNPAISGVVVTVLNPATFEEIAQAITDVNGLAALTLDLGTYEVRCQKVRTRFQVPSLIEVTALGPNGFSVFGTVLTAPTATDPRCCKVTGRFMGLNNRPISGATVRFASRTEIDSQSQLSPGIDNLSNWKIPIGVDGSFLSASAFLTQSDEGGYVSVDLIRGAELYVTFSGEDDQIWKFVVPDRPSANLFDLIHPKPSSLTWDSTDAPGAAVSVAVGSGVEIKYTTVFTDFVERLNSTEWVTVECDNTDIALVQGLDGKVVVAGVAAGTAHITVSFKASLHPTEVPEPTITHVPLTVTVTP